MTLLKVREMVFKTFKSEIILLPTDNYSEQSEQSEQLERSSNIFHQNQIIIQIHKIVHHKLMFRVVQTIYYLSKNTEREIKILIPK